MHAKEERRPTHLAVFDTEGTAVLDDPRGIYAVLYNWDLLKLDDQDSWPAMTRDNIGDLCTRADGRDVQSLYAQLDQELADAEDGGYTLKIGVHNLPYDYAYLRRWVNEKEDSYDVEVMAKSSTSLLTVKISRNKSLLMIIFDTLAIFNKSLRNLGNSLGFPKEHIDYSERIAPDTEYADANSSYNHRDTDVLMLAVCSSLLTRQGVTMDDLGTRVLTKTSIVRKLDREHPRVGALPISYRKSESRGVRRRKRKQIARTVYDSDRHIVERYQYASMRDFEEWASYGDSQTSEVKGCFAGGVNLSNAAYLGVESRDVISYDLKSAYPAIMLSMSVPADPIRVTDHFETYDPYLQRMAPSPVDVLAGRTPFWRGTVEFHGVEPDPDWMDDVNDTSITESMILQHRKESEGVRWRDGHFDGADKLVLTLCLPEYLEFCLQFTWDSARFTELTLYRGYQRPTHYTILRTIFHYREKSAAKSLSKAAKRGTLTKKECEDAEADGLITHDECLELQNDPDDLWLESFVLNHKGNLNSLYGIMVTNPMKDEYDLDPQAWIRDVERTKEEAFDAYVKSSRDSKMWREAGVCVALYNRYKITYMARMLVEAGATVLYTDTDSIKFTGLAKEDADALFKPLHDRIEARTHDVVAHCVDDVNARIAESGTGVNPVVMPDDPEFRALGKLDYEDTYERFVSFGHKKYAVWVEDRADGMMHWDYKCSGYNLRVLRDLSRQLESDDLADEAPWLVLGYDVRLDSSTGIATVQAGVSTDWIKSTIADAEDVTGDATRTHEWSGWTCPGFAILDAGKVMNNTENSALNQQRFARACRNNRLVAALARTDVAWRDGSYAIGPRGTVEMSWLKWDMKETGTGTAYL